MTSLFLLFVIAASVAAAPRNEAYEGESKTADETNGVSLESNIMPSNLKEINEDTSYGLSADENSETKNQVTTDSLTNSDAVKSEEVKSENPEILTTEGFKDGKSKKGRKHKAIFVDYPFTPQISSIPNFDLYDEFNTEGRTPAVGSGKRKNYHESDIYYIRLPPTPYIFVPGLGYISQPPTYSTGPIRPQLAHVRPHVNPYRPPSVYNSPLNEINPFINLPVDFVSNGKPTGVYQWQSSSYQPSKRPESQIATLNKGPYFFNGRPHSIYLLRPDARQPVHQSLQYPDYQDSNLYY